MTAEQQVEHILNVAEKHKASLDDRIDYSFLIEDSFTPKFVMEPQHATSIASVRGRLINAEGTRLLCNVFATEAHLMAAYCPMAMRTTVPGHP